LNVDFTSLSPDDEQFSKVTAILLDPSCSGSGLRRVEDTYPSAAGTSTTLSTEDITRLHALSHFQTRLLTHAMSFPSVDKVVYSTCSIHAQENEHVVAAAMDATTGWRVVRREEQELGLRTWERRGVAEGELKEEDVEGCVRCERGDGTIGFFAAGFVRTQEVVEEGEDEDEDEEEEWMGIPS